MAHMASYPVLGVEALIGSGSMWYRVFVWLYRVHISYRSL